MPGCPDRYPTPLVLVCARVCKKNRSNKNQNQNKQTNKQTKKYTLLGLRAKFFENV
jgi:hypothetical protein